MKRPNSLSAALVGATLTTIAAVGFILAPCPQAPDYPQLSDVPSGHVLTPGERLESSTDRGRKREPLAPSAYPSAR
jgi:hypothetical protein